MISRRLSRFVRPISAELAAMLERGDTPRFLVPLYLRCARLVSRAAGAVGLLDALERRRDVIPLFHLRTLFAIYDIDQLIRLDVPWWTYEVIRMVDAHIKKRPPGLRVFEYGSGASTVWLARRGAGVVSVENDSGFAEKMKTILASYDMVKFRCIPGTSEGAGSFFGSGQEAWEKYGFEDYVKSIDAENGEFDIIIVDGVARPACLGLAAKRLARGGFILLDNSNKARYQAAIRDTGLEIRRHRGFSPTLPYRTETAFLFRPGDAPAGSID